MTTAVRYAVVAYPKFSDRDAAWIESIRQHHDPLATLIRAHFTCVFPIDVPAMTLMAEARRAARRRQSFRIQLTSAVAHRDDVAPGSRVFLIPSIGREEIALLHRTLYEGDLQPHLRPAIPYVPHLTVAAKPLHPECAALADDLNAEAFSLNGVVDQLEVVAVAPERITSLAAYPLHELS